MWKQRSKKFIIYRIRRIDFIKKKLFGFLSIVVIILVSGCVKIVKESPNYIYLTVSPDVQKGHDNYYATNNHPIELNLALEKNLQADSIDLLLTLKTPSGKVEKKQLKAKVVLECHPCDQIAGEPNSCPKEPCTSYLEPSVVTFTTTKSEIGQYQITGKALDNNIEVKTITFTVISSESIDKIINS